MTKLHQLSEVLGGKVLSTLALIVACFIVLSGFWYQQQQVVEAAQSESIQLQERLIEMTFSNITTSVKRLTNKVALAAADNELIDAFQNGTQNSIDSQQITLGKRFPEALATCLISAKVDEPDLEACVPINFGVLALLRQAKAQPSVTPFAVTSTIDKQRILVVTHQIPNKSGKVVGVLLIVFEPAEMMGALPKLGPLEGFIALQQGKVQKTILKSSGDTRWKQDEPTTSRKLPGSYWNLAYWPPKQHDVQPFWGVVLAVLLSLILLWLWRDFWQSFMVREDMTVLGKQVNDWQEDKLKLDYPVAGLPAKKLVKTILELAALHAGSGHQATAETIKVSDELPVERLESIEIEELPVELEPASEEEKPVIQEQVIEIEESTPEEITSEQEAPNELLDKESSSGVEKEENYGAIDYYSVTPEKLKEDMEAKPEPKLEPPPVMPDSSLAFNDALNIQDTFEQIEISPVIEPLETVEVEASVAEGMELDMLDVELEAAPTALSVDTTVFLEPTIFRKYDIRGIVGDTLTEEGMMLLGLTLGRYLHSLGMESKAMQFVVGRDGRLSSKSLSQALVEGILFSGCDVLDIGEVPTPVLYFASENGPSKSGLMVTGSHNAANYNGLKMIVGGKSLSPEIIQALSTQQGEEDVHWERGILTKREFVADYRKEVVEKIDINRRVKVVVDAGSGVAGPVIVPLLEQLGCDVIPLYCDVDGEFPHHHPNPSEPDNLQDLMAQVIQHQADLGLAFDGDGDRLGVVDELGNIIWPDRQLALFAQTILEKQPGAAIVYDVKSSSYLKQTIESAGGKAVMSASGYPLIKEAMQEHIAPLAGEMSGHLFFGDKWYGFDDALYAACRLLEIIGKTESDVKVSALFSALPYASESTPELIVPMAEGEAVLVMGKFTKRGIFIGGAVSTLDGVRVEYADGWGLVRASHTSPCLVLRFEADNEPALQRIQAQFKRQLLLVAPTLDLPI